MTVAELKALIVGIPDRLNNLTVEMPEGLVLSVVTDEYEAQDGTRFHTTVALLDLRGGAVDELPAVTRQDYSLLFLPDGSRNPAAFEPDGRIKPGATDQGGAR